MTQSKQEIRSEESNEDIRIGEEDIDIILKTEAIFDELNEDPDAKKVKFEITEDKADQ